MLINPRTMWPALMLAASRIERVTGRTRILTVSTRTRKGLRSAGAPAGRRPAAVEEGFRIALEIIRDIHRGILRDKVIARWLVFLNTYGTRPRRFKISREENSAAIRFVNPPSFNPKDRVTCEEITFLGTFRR